MQLKQFTRTQMTEDLGHIRVRYDVGEAGAKSHRG